MSSTKVVKIARKNGQVVQGCDVYIGRACYMGGWQLPKSKWANPFSVKEYGSAEKAVEKFEEYLLSHDDLMEDIGELKGKILGCWCKKKGHEACHGDVLKKYADMCN
ncbi:Hypothetical protein ZAZAV_254 [Cedratvirus Zaza IHUMI]|uniref:DUF4326 domain-containing protein n=1 Tax=Cedratvirus Zaza IHUMI TaxID=2126979 RepID=A0A2R8FE68_9VIRU|nr:Hypothetical protein ZAZAV_254 [Cedratvirus Zaza IHUMI]